MSIDGLYSKLVSGLPRAAFLVCLSTVLALSSAPTSAAAAEGAAVEKLCQSSCKAANGAFCIDVETGEAFCTGKDDSAYALPAALDVGATLILRVMGAEGIGGEVKLATTFVRSVEKLTEGPAPRIAGVAPEEPKYVELQQLVVKIPDETGLESLSISYEWTPPDNASPVAKRHDVAINHGKYYLDVGLLLPFVANGARTVNTGVLPGTGGERRITVSQDSIVSPALALDLFPGGRRRGRVSSFSPFRFWDLVGVQIGVNIDLTRPFEQLYAGVVLEPIAGLGFSTGLALVKGQLVPSGYAEGMLVPEGETLTPDTRYMPRWYMGLTVTTDVLTTVLGAAKAIRGTKID